MVVFTPHGARCREECPVGSFGQDCNGTCDCAPGAHCFPANGACLCEHGFTGHRCAERLCPDGLYGLSCQTACTCDPEHSLRWVSGGGCGTGTLTPGPVLRSTLSPKLSPNARRVRLPARLGGPTLQRELPAGHTWAWLSGALPVPERWRLPGRQRPLPVRARLHGETHPARRLKG